MAIAARARILPRVSTLAVLLLPLVAVTDAPECPDRSVLAEALAEQVHAESSDGADYRLAVTIDPDGRARASLADRGGRLVLDRVIDAPAGTSCVFLSRSIATVVERFLAGLPAVPADAAVRVARPVEAPRARHLVEARAALALGLGAPEGDLAAGATVGILVRPLGLVLVALDGGVELPRSEPARDGSIFLEHYSARLWLGVSLESARWRLEGGPTLRLDVTRVGGEDLPSSTSATRVNPALGLVAAASLALGSRLAAFALLEGYRPFTSQVFEVRGVGVVARTPEWGVGLSLGVGLAIVRSE